MVRQVLNKMTRKTALYVPLMLCMTGFILILSSGCKKEAEPEQKFDPSRVSTVEERMADPAYVKQLDAQRDQQKKLAQLLAKATNDADRAAVEAALERNRQESMRLIRERMRSGK